MAVIVNARPEHVWPWLVQMGYRRGGLYSYDWLDRLFGYLDRPSATGILPDFQHLAVGDEIPLGRGLSWPVAIVEPHRALVLDIQEPGRPGLGLAVWSLPDRRETNATRVAQPRVRAHSVDLVVDAGDRARGFIMTRRMLHGIKQRAEALAAARHGLRAPVHSPPAEATRS